MDDSKQISSTTELGIITNHTYGILEVREVQNLKLLRIRNPWGEGEWKGRWSDHSK
jgi:hypothetical protein